jgi:hypothetical protein
MSLRWASASALLLSAMARFATVSAISTSSFAIRRASVAASTSALACSTRKAKSCRSSRAIGLPLFDDVVVVDQDFLHLARQLRTDDDADCRRDRAGGRNPRRSRPATDLREIIGGRRVTRRTAGDGQLHRCLTDIIPTTIPIAITPPATPAVRRVAGEGDRAGTPWSTPARATASDRASMPIMHQGSLPPHLHWPAGPVHVDGWGLFPAGFVEVVVVVHPGLPLQVLVLPPWVVVVVVVNPVFSPAASAAFGANANEPTSRRAEISFVMGFLLC